MGAMSDRWVADAWRTLDCARAAWRVLAMFAFSRSACASVSTVTPPAASGASSVSAPPVQGGDGAKSVQEGAEMERLFDGDIKEALEITPAAWDTRGIGRRLMETLGRMWEYWL